MYKNHTEGYRLQHTPVFLHRESHGQRSLAGYSPWGLKESDTTEHMYKESYNLKASKFAIVILIFCYILVPTLDIITSNWFSIT